VSEVSALINRNHRALTTHRAQLSQIQAKGVVEEVKRLNDQLINVNCRIEPDELDPDKILEVIDGGIATLDAKYVTDGTVMTREIADRLIDFLKKKVRMLVFGNPCSCLSVLKV
jgi:hypothetical protein